MAGRVRGTVAGAVLAALLVAGRAAGEATRGPSSITWVEGGRAPADAWLQDDACAARTGACATEVFTGLRESAWRFEVKGEVEGDPLAWRGKTYVVEKAGGKRTLHVLSTETGVERASKTFDTTLPLAPCVAEGRVLVRSSPRTLQSFTVAEKALTPRWTFTAKVAVGPPTMLKDEVYAVVDGALCRIAYGAAQPAWKAPDPVRVDAGKGTGSSELPRPSARGGSIFLATGTHLFECDRDDGHVLRDGTLPVAVDPAAARVVVGLGDVLVQTGKPFPGEGGKTAGEADTVRFAMDSTGSFDERTPLKLPAGVTCLGRDWIGLATMPGGTILAHLGATDLKLDDEHAFANKDAHAEYLAVKTPPTGALDVAIVGGRMFDAGTWKVLQPAPLVGVSRVVPLVDRLLVVETRNRVAAWRPAGKPSAPAPLVPPGSEGVESTPLPAASHAVVEDGRVVAGPFVYDGKAHLLRTGAGKAAESWPLSSVRALATDEAPARLLACARPQDAAWAVLAAGRAAAAVQILALVPKALEAKDAIFARRLQMAAAERGAPDADVQKHDKAIAAVEAAGGSRDESAISEVDDRLKEIVGRENDVLLEAASSVPADAPTVYATALVRAVVARSPYHSGATAWVRAHLPEGLNPPGFKDLDDWLDFIDLRATTTVRILGPGMTIPDDVPGDVREALTKAREEWRRDLVGFLDGELLVVSPPEHPAAIATCLTLGKIVSRTHDAAFSVVGPRRPDAGELVLHLFPNKAEYLAAGSHGGTFGHLEHSAGHYSPRDNVTRIFWPSGGDGDEVPGVYCHELTHHWVGVRRPKRDGADDPPDASGGPGYWICEGIADFMKDHAYDVPAGKADPNNPRAHYADVVAGLQEKDLYPWAHFLGMTQHEAYSGDFSKEIKVRLRYTMGIDRTYDPVNIWYAQSAATTAFLFLAEGGKYRSAVFDFLYDHYAGTASPDALLSKIGLTADELGAKIVAWCKSLGATYAK